MTELTFTDRRQAGRLLGRRLAEDEPGDPVVLGLPRGGVVVAAEVAKELGAPLDVVVARKIGHPRQKEYGLGAIAEGGEPVFDERALRQAGLSAGSLARVVEAERDELARRVTAYRAGRALPDLAGRTVLLVDDGIATGVTARASLRALRAHQPGRLVLAAPVASPEAVTDLATEADDVVVLVAPPDFTAVARWYSAFPQTSDREVLDLLATARGRRSQ